MKSRLFGIKKTIWLWFSSITLFLLFVATSLYCTLALKLPQLWFYCFCACFGLHQFFKSVLFRLDSCFYGGLVLIFVSIAGFVNFLAWQSNYFCCLILSAFVLASLVTFFVYKQKFHLIFSYSLFFADIFTYIFLKNLITLPIFIAFLVPFLVLLIVEVALYIKRRN